MVTLKILAGGQFQREVEANAKRGRTTPERWLTVAVQHFGRVLPYLQKGNGNMVVGKGDEIRGFARHTIEEYREAAPIKAYEGISFTDLGGYPYGSPRWKVSIDTAQADLIMELTGASSRVEAIGFAIWCQSRFINALREDYPGWEPGILLSDGVFRSMSKNGYFRRLPGATYDPVVPRSLPIDQTIREWLHVITELEARPVQGAFRDCPPAAGRVPLLGCTLDGSTSAAGEALPHSVIQKRPMIEIALFGPSPNDVIAITLGVNSTPGSSFDNPDGEATFDMVDALYDPFMVLEIKHFLKDHPASIVVAAAGVFGCPHGSGARFQCEECPGWKQKSRVLK